MGLKLRATLIMEKATNFTMSVTQVYRGAQRVMLCVVSRQKWKFIKFWVTLLTISNKYNYKFLAKLTHFSVFVKYRRRYRIE